MHILWSNFSQGLDLESCSQPSQKVRPKGVCIDTLANEGMDLEGDEGNIPGEWHCEGGAIPLKNIVYQPSKEEWDEHMVTHLSFRAWCPCCVQGKSVSGAHKRILKTASDQESEFPTMRYDYLGPKSKEDKSEKIDSLSILVGVDGLKWK